MTESRLVYNKDWDEENFKGWGGGKRNPGRPVHFEEWMLTLGNFLRAQKSLITSMSLVKNKRV